MIIHWRVENVANYVNMKIIWWCRMQLWTKHWGIIVTKNSIPARKQKMYQSLRFLFFVMNFPQSQLINFYIFLGLGEHAHFKSFGMAFLTLFRVATGDNWNGIMKDTLRKDCNPDPECLQNCCVSPVIAPIFFVIFVLMAQFVLVNVVVAVSTIKNETSWRFFKKYIFWIMI